MSSKSKKGKIETIISKMTLREKIGQMSQINLASLIDENTHKLDEKRLDLYIKEYNVGSFINNMYDKGDSPPPTPTEWAEMLNKIQKKYAETRMKIPMIYGLDCIHGANYILGATLFPHQLALASTFNLELTQIAASITAKDTRAVGIHWTFSPVLDIAVNKQWGRIFETFGEDPYLSGEMGKAMIMGYQGYPKNLKDKKKIAATMKHFIGYSATHSGKDVDGGWISDRIIYDYFQPPFDKAIEAGVATTMESYSDISGEHVVNSKKYLVDMLRKKMKFEGVLVTDWGQIDKLHNPIRIANSSKEAVRMSMKHGSIDISMIPNDVMFIEYMEELLKEEKLSMKNINKSLKRILELKESLGLLDKHDYIENKDLINNIGTKEDNAISLEAAREGVILLKNRNNLLPLNKNCKVLLTGPTSNSIRFLNGGWTFKWPGPEDDQWFKRGSTILSGLKKHSQNIHYIDSINIDGEEITSIQDFKNRTKLIDPDIIVFCIGEKNYVESSGDIDDMKLPAGQINYVEKLAGSGKPIVLVMSQGRPRVVGDVVNKVDAILNGFLLGPHGGEAYADVVFGKVNPSGKLPLTYSNYPNGNTLNYYRRVNEKYKVQWPFGFGLSYTRFKYINLRLDKSILKYREQLEVSIEVKNVGDISGKEVVMMYITDSYRSISPEKHKLKRFEKLFLAPNQTKTIGFSINVDDLAFIGHDCRKRVEAGEFIITIGDQSVEFRLELPSDKEFMNLN